MKANRPGKKREARKKLKEEQGKLPDDLYTCIASVDAYNFKEADAYYGQGFALHMIVKRHQLESFASQLQSEYMDFKKAFEVDEWLEKHG